MFRVSEKKCFNGGRNWNRRSVEVGGDFGFLAVQNIKSNVHQGHQSIKGAYEILGR